jgi:hypothetical protein
MTTRGRKRRTEDVPPVRPPFADLPLWHEVKPYIVPELGSQNQSRFTFHGQMPKPLRERALAVETRCAGCQQSHHPYRCHVGSSDISIHVTGPRDDGHRRCSYGERAQAQIHWLRIQIRRCEYVPTAPPAPPAGRDLLFGLE